MKLRYGSVLLAYLFLIGGCGEGGGDSQTVDPDVTKPITSIPDDENQSNFSTPWLTHSQQDYLSENSVEFRPSEFVAPLYANVTYSEAFEKHNDVGNKTYGFDDIAFESIGLNEYFIVNNTPDRISTLLVGSTSFQDSALLMTDIPLAPFSRNKVVFQQNIADLTLLNTTNMFLPTITMTGDVSAQEGAQCTAVCYSEPSEQQAEVYAVLSGNLHKAMNHKSFLPEMVRFYRDDWCADSNRACDAEIAYTFYMRMGTKGHRLSLKVLSGPYTNEGVGGGGSPKLVDMTTNSGGWLSIWTGYITEGTAQARPYDGRTQKTFFHEGAHGYGFNHDSGMTYGLADYYGLEFLDKYFTAEDINGVSELKPSSIVPVLVSVSDNHLKYKLVKLEEGDDVSKVFARVITPENIGKRDRFVVEGGRLFYELELEQSPTQAVVIQFYDDATERVSTVREIANFYQPESITASGSPLQFFELPKMTLQEQSYISVNAICRKYLPDSQGATKAQYQTLWNASDFDPARLVGRYFISSNMSQTNHRWRIDMKNTDTYNETSEDRYTKFAGEDSLLCVK